MAERIKTTWELAWDLAGLNDAPEADQAESEHEADMAEAEAARADIIARLERLTQRVRTSTTTDIKKLDAAYSEIVKLAHVLKPILA